jgi:hypothetical protein
VFAVGVEVVVVKRVAARIEHRVVVLERPHDYDGNCRSGGRKEGRMKVEGSNGQDDIKHTNRAASSLTDAHTTAPSSNTPYQHTNQ